MTRLFGVVPAAGGGTRFGTASPKQYALLDGVPLLVRTLDRLQSGLAFEAIVVALAPDDARYERVVGTRTDVEPLRCGGRSRSETVRNALRAIASRCKDDDWVLVHDAARPCVPPAALSRLVRELGDDPVGGLLAMPLADTLKRADDRAGGEASQARVVATMDREWLWCAQTPQMFRHGVLMQALEADVRGLATDESQAVEALGHRPRLVMGSWSNLKITYPDDLALAAAIIACQRAPASGSASAPGEPPA